MPASAAAILNIWTVPCSLIGQGVTHLGAVLGHKAAGDLGLDTQPGAADLIGQVFGIQPGSIPGHEFVAEVVEVGEGVTGLGGRRPGGPLA